MTLLEVREILDWMAGEEGGQRVEWVGREGDRSACWVYWRRPEEWADAIATWVGWPCWADRKLNADLNG
jgi:ESCRT-II complex subunit VPS25